jgi:hypothetical protein
MWMGVSSWSSVVLVGWTRGPLTQIQPLPELNECQLLTWEDQRDGAHLLVESHARPVFAGALHRGQLGRGEEGQDAKEYFLVCEDVSRAMVEVLRVGRVDTVSVRSLWF